MKDQLLQLIYQANPWIRDDTKPITQPDYIPRIQAQKLLLPEWDSLWLILTGPRQAGKTTLAKYLAQTLIAQQRFEKLIYLNCDVLEIREWLTTTLFVREILSEFRVSRPIILIDEVQRLENPGLLLKACADLQLPIKMMATGSSQLELKSKVQEFLTGRHLESRVLPLSFVEIGQVSDEQLVYGCYPAIVKSTEKSILLRQIHEDYINKDIIEILKVSRPDSMQKLITLVAHSSGQLVNYNRLATDVQLTAPTVQQYLSILENTYTVAKVTPFVGNKRKEITSNPVYYFLDNGFRNQSLRELSMNLDSRHDAGLLIQSAVFQEMMKLKVQRFYDFTIHFWRTQSGAEVDFVLYKNAQCVIPVEVKYQTFSAPSVSRSFRSFLEAYTPQHAFVITRDFTQQITLNECQVHFISLRRLTEFCELLRTLFDDSSTAHSA